MLGDKLVQRKIGLTFTLVVVKEIILFLEFVSPHVITNHSPHLSCCLLYGWIELVYIVDRIDYSK